MAGTPFGWNCGLKGTNNAQQWIASVDILQKDTAIISQDLFFSEDKKTEVARGYDRPIGKNVYLRKNLSQNKMMKLRLRVSKYCLPTGTQRCSHFVCYKSW